MKKNTLIFIIMLIVAAAITAGAYFLFAKYPPPTNIPSSGNQNSMQEDKSMSPSADADAVSAATSDAAAIDAGVDALIGSYGLDQSVVSQEDVDSAFVEQDSAVINSLSDSYDAKNF